CEKNDRHVASMARTAQSLCRSETVDPRETHVEEDESKIMEASLHERLLAAASAYDARAVALNHGLNGEDVCWRVVDDQNFDVLFVAHVVSWKRISETSGDQSDQLFAARACALLRTRSALQ